MEVSDVRRRVLAALERSRQQSAGRRALVDEAAREYARFLETVAVPLFRQVANVLKAEGQFFTVNTPGGSVRLASDRSAEAFIELSLDTTGPVPVVLGHASRTRGGRVIQSERPIGAGPIQGITEDQVLSYVMEELEPLL